MLRRPVRFHSAGETLAGELALPDALTSAAPPGKPKRYPAVLLIGGTISDTRDGDPAASLAGKMPRHGMFRVMAEFLAGAGIASLRWDKRGVGESTGPDRDEHCDVWTDVADAERAYSTLRAEPDVDPERVAVLGESAGAYFACLLAARLRPEEAPAAYVMQAALYASMADMLAFNYQRVANYCAGGPQAEAWVRQVASGALVMGLHWQAVLSAAQRGEEVYTAAEAEPPLRVTLRRYRQELEIAPAEQFKYLQRPVLVIQGDCDMNVPPGDCRLVARAIREAGNPSVTLVVVPGADHSMQMAAEDLETRVRERISMQSFQRPYSEVFLRCLADWLWEHFHA